MLSILSAAQGGTASDWLGSLLIEFVTFQKLCTSVSFYNILLFERIVLFVHFRETQIRRTEEEQVHLYSYHIPDRNNVNEEEPICYFLIKS